jgi:hypothetical protein
MALLFAFGAIVQLNDPDPIRWVVMYVAALAVSVTAAIRGTVPLALPAAVGLVALAWALFIAAGGPGPAEYLQMFQEWEMRSPQVEEAREASGLVIILGWMAAVAIFRPKG